MASIEHHKPRVHSLSTETTESIEPFVLYDPVDDMTNFADLLIATVASIAERAKYNSVYLSSDEYRSNRNEMIKFGNKWSIRVQQAIEFFDLFLDIPTFYFLDLEACVTWNEIEWEIKSSRVIRYVVLFTEQIKQLCKS
jgi:hypothetical protein